MVRITKVKIDDKYHTLAAKTKEGAAIANGGQHKLTQDVSLWFPKGIAVMGITVTADGEVRLHEGRIRCEITQ